MINLIGGLVLWLILSVIVGLIGSQRRIGFFLAFITSFFLSPLIGLIITLCSKDLETLKLQEEKIRLQRETLRAINPKAYEEQEKKEAAQKIIDDKKAQEEAAIVDKDKQIAIKFFGGFAVLIVGLYVFFSLIK